MTVVPIRAIEPPHQSETDIAWHIFAALAQYAAHNEPLAANEMYMEAMCEAHAHWAAMFAQ